MAGTPEWLVSVEIRVPPDVPAEEVERRRAIELRLAEEFRRQGALVRIWRMPGRWANWAIWSASDATELHRMLMTLPLYQWAEVTVHPLAAHPVENPTSG